MEPGKRELTKLLAGDTHWLRATAWSPDGRWIAIGGDDRIVRTWDTDTGRVAALPEVHVGAIVALAWSPDGTALVSCGSDGELMVQ